MRILIYTGKGGVGKTSMAALAACRLAELGRKVLIMSTDPAHSLGDSLGMELGNAPTEVFPNLEAVEIDAVEESKGAWGGLHDYMRVLISMKAEGGIEADEALIFPGLEELFSMLRILDAYEAGKHDVLVVDCAPTGETLALLRFPEKLGALSERMLPFVRMFTKLMGPAISEMTKVPKPGDHVFAEFEALIGRLQSLQSILRDRDVTSLRIVTTPEKIVLEEARRNYTWMHLYDFNVDAVIMNRIYPVRALDGYFSGWARMQEESLRVAEESFPGPRLFRFELQEQELRGVPALLEAGRTFYGEVDPGEVFCKEQVFRVEKVDGWSYFVIYLPFMEEGEFELVQMEDELLLSVRNQTRRFRLPERLHGRTVEETTYADGQLRIRMSNLI